MSRPRVSIAGLLGVVGVAALGLAALKIADEIWAGGMASLTLFLLVASLLGIGLGRNGRRAFWIGFALLGWAHWLALRVPVLNEAVGQFLLAPRLADPLERYLHPPLPPGEAAVGATWTATPAGAPGGFRSVFMGGFGGSVATMMPFGGILAALETLLWAVLGGWLARYFASDRAARPLPPAVVSVEPPAPAPAPEPMPAPAPTSAPAPPTFRLGSASEGRR